MPEPVIQRPNGEHRYTRSRVVTAITLYAAAQLDPGIAGVMAATVAAVPATFAAVFSRSVPEIRRRVDGIDQRLTRLEER